MSDLREQAERMVEERLGFRIRKTNDPNDWDVLLYPNRSTVAMPQMVKLWSECVRLQVELLAEKESK